MRWDGEGRRTGQTAAAATYKERIWLADVVAFLLDRCCCVPGCNAPQREQKITMQRTVLQSNGVYRGRWYRQAGKARQRQVGNIIMKKRRGRSLLDCWMEQSLLCLLTVGDRETNSVYKLLVSGGELLRVHCPPGWRCWDTGRGTRDCTNYSRWRWNPVDQCNVMDFSGLRIPEQVTVQPRAPILYRG